MKKLIICILVSILGLTTLKVQAQGNKPSQFQLNPTTHGDIRNTINFAFDAIFDTSYAHKLLFTSLIQALDIRIGSLENAPVSQIKLLGSPVAGQIALWHNNDSTLYALDLFYLNNNLGIGVANPTSKIELTNGTALAVYTQYVAGTTTGQSIGDGFITGIDGTGKAWINQQENMNIGFSVNSTEELTITPTTFDIKTDIRFPNVVPVGTYSYGYLDPADNIFKFDNSYVLGSKVLTTTLIPLEDLLKDNNKEGEIRWPSIDDNGNVKWIYRTKDMQFGKMLSLDQCMAEATLRYTKTLQDTIKKLQVQLDTEVAYRESLEKKINQFNEDISYIKHKISKRESK